jgi:hypothetical protein
VTVTAPPRPPATGDPADWGDPEALIAEARQRARRRRRRYGVAVAVLALLATSLIVVFGRPEPSQSLSPEPPRTLPIPPDPDDPTSIVAKFAKFHGGWVVVYGDGRVVTSEMTERRLTANALDLVRSGAIEPAALIYVARSLPQKLPADTWADPEFKPYVPSRYAACLDPGNLDWFVGSRPGHATEMVGRLPAAARPLLRGTELREYSNDLFSDSDLFPPDSFWPHPVPMPPDPPVECFEVSTKEAIVFFKALRQAGFAFGWVIGDHDEGIRLAPPPPWAGAVRGPCGGVEQPAAVEVCFMPLLPHGQWYDMPG